TNISPSQDFFASGFFHFLTRSSNPPSPPGVWTFFDALNNNFTVTQIGSHDFPGQCAAAYINAERFSGVGGLPSFGYTTSQIVAFIQQGVASNPGNIDTQLDFLNSGREPNGFC